MAASKIHQDLIELSYVILSNCKFNLFEGEIKNTLLKSSSISRAIKLSKHRIDYHAADKNKKYIILGEAKTSSDLNNDRTLSQLIDLIKLSHKKKLIGSISIPASSLDKLLETINLIDNNLKITIMPKSYKEVINSNVIIIAIPDNLLGGEDDKE
jgi:hypothetical protein